MRRTSPYCQSKTAANAQSPVKIIQWSRGARSGTPRVSRSDDMVVTLMFRPPRCGNDDAAFYFNSKRSPDALRGSPSCTAVLNFMRAKTDRGVPPMGLDRADGKVLHLLRHSGTRPSSAVADER